MEKIAKTVLIALSMLLISSFAFAGKDHHKMPQWICETNASSASSDSDKKADEMMKTASGGKHAFEFALKHCRDCTKITCTSQSDQSQTTNSSNVN